MPVLVVALCAAIMALLAFEGLMWALDEEGSLVVAALDAFLIALIASAMRPTAKARARLRAVSASISLVTAFAEVFVWPPDTSSSFMLAHFIVQVALVIACAALFITLRHPAVRDSRSARVNSGVKGTQIATDLESSFYHVCALVNSTPNARDGWRSLASYLAAEVGAHVAESLQAVSIDRDVAAVRSQIESAALRDPLPDGIDALWFGLFDTRDDDGAEQAGYYIAGIRGFDPEDPDSRCSPAWWPEGRYLECEALATIKTLELDARARGDEAASSFLGYAGQLGAALLVSRFAARALAGQRQVVVGFDSGDYATVVA